MLTGRRPFEAENQLTLIHETLTALPVEPGKRQPGVSPEIDAVVMRALSKDPAERWASVTEFAKAFQTRGWRHAGDRRADVRGDVCWPATNSAMRSVGGALAARCTSGRIARSGSASPSACCGGTSSRTGARSARAFCSRRARCRSRIPTCSTSAISVRTNAWSTSSPTSSTGRACARSWRRKGICRSRACRRCSRRCSAPRPRSTRAAARSSVSIPR